MSLVQPTAALPPSSLKKDGEGQVTTSTSIFQWAPQQKGERVEHSKTNSNETLEEIMKNVRLASGNDDQEQLITGTLGTMLEHRRSNAQHPPSTFSPSMSSPSIIMRVIVSMLPTHPDMQSSTQTYTSPRPDSPPSSRPSPRPTHISLSPQPPVFATISLSRSSSPSQRENPFERPLLSPGLSYYTVPSTPLSSQDPEISLENEAFPIIDQVPVDPFLDDEDLRSLEKIYLFSRSQTTSHRCVSVY
jgi:hypothetical protein